MQVEIATLKADGCSNCPIRHRAVCARCDADELKLLEAMKYYRSYDAGQTIMWRGDRMEVVASVVTGTAAIERNMEDGRKQMVGLLLPSDFIGRPGRETASYDVVAISNVTLCCFRRGPFEKLIKTTPHVGERVLEMALDELDSARDWMLLLGRKTAREKIASFLTLIARRSSAADMSIEEPIAIDLPLTRDVIASYLGLTIETVSRQFSKLKAEGIIELDGAKRVLVPRPLDLIEAAGEDDTDTFNS